ncbi:MAG: glycoside hydrolase family 3 N-terminal domain-containing protein [Bacteroidales bacterium]|nr:glycoside hydrolase family 3 N-terminal domain-containing protein [Bacteroidales bacterium]MDP3003251.1 glycoside hydrolase family 3 N-terminal domain-containing protein [Bacteroidales bacterium]
MMRIKILLTLILFTTFFYTGCKNQLLSDLIIYENKADSIINLMTIDEKIGQLSLFTSDWSTTGPTMRKDYIDLIKQGKAGNIFNAYTVDYVKDLQKIAMEETRMHIPMLFGYDVIHGHRTIFPIPLAQASSWDTAAIEKAERIAAIEATAEGLNWTFAPMVDLARDPRWGRVMEGSGEDTWLGGLIAAARVRGFQGSDLSDKSSMLACVKHFAAYGAPQGGRDYNTVDMSERSLYEWYLPVYKSAINAGVASVMTSFNEIAGIPSTSNKWLLTDLLHNEWKFKGFVVTDYSSINELINHGVAVDLSEAASLSINAGVDMDMQGSAFVSHLDDLVKSGKVSEETLNSAVKRILVAKYELGLFDDPYKYCDKKREKEEIMRPEYLDFAREFAGKSCVLLKNEKGTLPVREDIKTLAVIGPLADSKADMLGFWSAAGQWEKCVTLLEGINNKVNGTVKILSAKGCNVNDDNTSGINQAVSVARRADFVILALGESKEMSGESASRTDIDLPGVQIELARAVIRTGKPVAVVLFNGRPLAIQELDEIAPAILDAWFGGTQAGNGIADVLFGDVNPSGKLTMTFPRNVGQIPIFYNTKNTGRPINPEKPYEKFKSNYLDSPNTPLYPFGYGLSYTSFKYSVISLNKTGFQKDDHITASVDITNTGDRDGEEIAQLYVYDLVGDVTRPLKELKGFKKVLIEKGKTVSVTFTLSPSDLSYYHTDMSFSFDPGDFELFIGPNSSEGSSVSFSIL